MTIPPIFSPEVEERSKPILKTTTRGENNLATTQNLAASIGRNTLFGIIASVIQVATRLVTVPIMIKHLGLGGYGIWSIILVTATYMRFGSIGVKSAFQKYVAEATESQNYRHTSTLLSTGTAGLLAFSVITLIPACFFSRSIAGASGIPPEFLGSATWSVSILAIIAGLANIGAGYEAIVMGGHRIDLLRKFATLLTIAEAIGMVAALELGQGIFVMSLVMGASEISYVTYCYFCSKKVVPQITIKIQNVSRTVGRELLRFAGSYQILSILQLIYGSIVPIAVLRAYGANQAGVFAIANRLISPVMMAMYAFLLPILSSSAMVFASGSVERMRNLLTKSFKVTLGLTLLPLALVCAFGTQLVFAWTGQTDPSFRPTLSFVSLGTFFQAFSLLGLVLYRASGKAVLDNLREVLRILTLLPVVYWAHRLGFIGVLGGMAFADFVGMAFMLFSLSKTYHAFNLKALLSDFLRLALAVAGIVIVSAMAIKLLIPQSAGARTLAVIKLGIVGAMTLLAAYPFLSLTGAISKPEVQAILNVFRKKTGTASTTAAAEL